MPQSLPSIMPKRGCLISSNNGALTKLYLLFDSTFKQSSLHEKLSTCLSKSIEIELNVECPSFLVFLWSNIWLCLSHKIEKYSLKGTIAEWSLKWSRVGRGLCFWHAVYKWGYSQNYLELNRDFWCLRYQDAALEDKLFSRAEEFIVFPHSLFSGAPLVWLFICCLNTAMTGCLKQVDTL